MYLLNSLTSITTTVGTVMTVTIFVFIAVYTEHAFGDFPGQYDYNCRYSHGGKSCTISVFDRQEAEFLCNVEPECRAFVLTKHKTWTGEIMAMACCTV